MYNTYCHKLGGKKERITVMKGYIISIAAAAVISAVTAVTAPERWSKYVGIVTGLVITLCIGRPVLELMHTDVFEGLDYSFTPSVEYSDSEYRKKVISELETQVSDDVKARLDSEFGQDCEVETVLGVNPSGEITGVECISIYGGNIDSAAIGRLREVYGANYVKKITEKPE